MRNKKFLVSVPERMVMSLDLYCLIKDITRNKLVTQALYKMIDNVKEEIWIDSAPIKTFFENSIEKK